MPTCPKCRRPVADNDVCEYCHDTRIRYCAVCGEDIHGAECDWAAVAWADMRDAGEFDGLYIGGWVCGKCYDAWHNKKFNPERGSKQ